MAEEIYVQHYRRLTLAQIHAAMAFYYDHQAEFDDQIRRDDEAFERLRRDAGPTPFATRMRREGHIPQGQDFNGTALKDCHDTKSNH